MKNALSFDEILPNITHVFRKGEFLRKREKEDFILPSKHVSDGIKSSLTKRKRKIHENPNLRAS